MQIGSNVKWTADDASYVGILKSFTGKRYTIGLQNCTIEFNVGDGIVEPYEGVVFSVEPESDTSVITTPLVAPPSTGTKLERARTIYTNMVGASRKEVIQAFVTDLNMTVAGASTYYATCKKVLTPTLN